MYGGLSVHVFSCFVFKYSLRRASTQYMTYRLSSAVIDKYRPILMHVIKEYSSFYWWNTLITSCIFFFQLFLAHHLGIYRVQEASGDDFALELIGCWQCGLVSSLHWGWWQGFYTFYGIITRSECVWHPFWLALFIFRFLFGSISFLEPQSFTFSVTAQDKFQQFFPKKYFYGKVGSSRL